MKTAHRIALALALSLLTTWALAYLPDEEPVPAPPKPEHKVRPIPAPVPKQHHAPRHSTQQTDKDGGRVEVLRHTGGKTFSDCGDCPEMVRIPGGKFMMGSSSSEQDSQADEKPYHSVRVDSFAIGKYEVTKEQYAAFVDKTGYAGGGDCYTWNGSKWGKQAGADWRNLGYSQARTQPVVCVSLQDAEAYARWLSGKTGKHYRLPTEAEWEYAARAGTDTTRYWGDGPNQACRYANVADETGQQKFNWESSYIHHCADGYVHTAPVGSFSPNRFGLYDMMGNVREWTCSAYTERGYDGSEISCIDDVTSRRVYRGGSWASEPAHVRSADRYGFDPADRDVGRGFRLLQD